MARIFIELWPAFLPLGIFLIWYFRNRRSEDPAVYDSLRIRKKKYLYYAIVLSCLIVIGLLGRYALEQPSQIHQDINNNQVNSGSNVH